MKRSILIVCVNYNTYNELNQYLSSIEKSAGKLQNINVNVIIADNSTFKQSVNTNRYDHINVETQKLDNIGYLKGAQYVINRVPDIKKYDFVIISNVDILMKEDFFTKLYDYRIDQNIAWIAPQIFSKNENRDLNPKVLSRYSKKKLSMLYYMYKYPVLFYLYTATVYKRKKIRSTYPEMDIYAGHGSFIILTRTFFENQNDINYPVFLFGEELYLAEKIRIVGKKVKYVPSIIIYDNEHVSTSKMKKKSYFKYNQESIKYILDTFYHE